MHLFQHIEKYEKSIRQYWENKDDKKYACTVIHDLKLRVDYINKNPENWDNSYFKLLQEYCYEKNIIVPKGK